MWSRQEVKAKGKENFKRNYWKSVIVAVIYSIFFASTAATTYKNSGEISSSFQEAEFSTLEILAILAVVMAVIGTALFICTIIDIFLLNPLEVGCSRFFLINSDTNADFNELGYAFKHNYLAVALGIFLRNLLISIGVCIFIIPGCILSYSYRMVPYILSEEPDISAIDALKKSRQMMKGHKWNCFVYDLSFILWYILSAFTLGLLNVFYVSPYKHNADAELYKAIRG